MCGRMLAMKIAWITVAALMVAACGEGGEPGRLVGRARGALGAGDLSPPEARLVSGSEGAGRVAARVLRPGMPESCQAPLLVATDLALADLPPFIEAARAPGAHDEPAGLGEPGGADGPRRDVALLREDGSLWVYTGGRASYGWRVDAPVRPGLSWSADGRRLAYARGADATDSDIWVVDIRGGERARVTERPGPETRPAFAFDGQRLAWVGSQSGLPAIFVSDLRGGAARQVTNRGLSAAGHGLPGGFVPPPIGPAPARWEGDWLRYDAGDALCAVHVVTGRARCQPHVLGGAP